VARYPCAMSECAYGKQSLWILFMRASVLSELEGPK